MRGNSSYNGQATANGDLQVINPMTGTPLNPDHWWYMP